MSFSGGTSGTRSKSSEQNSGTSEQAPWKPAQPYLERILGLADNLQRSGKGAKYYGPSVVPNANADTTQGQGLIRQRAGAGSPLRDAAKQQVQGGLQNAGQVNPQSLEYLQSLISGGQNPASALERFRNIDQDDTLGRIQQLNEEELLSGFANQFSSQGRNGSPAHQQTLGRELGRLNLQTQLQLQDRALGVAGGLDAQSQANANRRVAGSDLLGRLRSGRATDLTNLSGAAENLAQGDYRDGQQLIDIGKQEEGREALKLAEKKAKYDYNQQAPFNIIQWLQRIQGGIGGLGNQAQYQNQGTKEGKSRTNTLGFEGAVPFGGLFGG